MPAYVGYAGYANMRLGASVSAPSSVVRAGVTQWLLRVQYDAQYSLPVDYGAVTFPFLGAEEGHGAAVDVPHSVNRFRRIRRCHPSGATAELQFTGHWDEDDDPFAEPGTWTQQTDAARNGWRCDFELRPKEDEPWPSISGNGSLLGLEITASVRSLVTFTARVAVNEVLEYFT